MPKGRVSSSASAKATSDVEPPPYQRWFSQLAASCQRMTKRQCTCRARAACADFVTVRIPTFDSAACRRNADDSFPLTPASSSPGSMSSPGVSGQSAGHLAHSGNSRTPSLTHEHLGQSSSAAGGPSMGTSKSGANEDSSAGKAKTNFKHGRACDGEHSLLPSARLRADRAARLFSSMPQAQGQMQRWDCRRPMRGLPWSASCLRLL